MAPFFRNRMALQRRKDAALDLMIRATAASAAPSAAISSASSPG